MELIATKNISVVLIAEKPQIMYAQKNMWLVSIAPYVYEQPLSFLYNNMLSTTSNNINLKK